MKRHGVRVWPAAFYFVFAIAILNLSRAAPPDASAGKNVFAKRCSGCHSPDSDKEGPRLRGVLGRKAGTVAGFQYSEPLRNSEIIWDESLLNKWIENPDNVVLNNDMEFRVADPDERAAIVAYLKSLSQK